ncbi:MAG TPA: hypothetical protein VF559_09695 [Caulobacteraceae bacterium]|jgi:hypothetical protein
MPENQTQPNAASYANPSGEPRIREEDPAASGEDRSFADRPSDTEAAHAPNEGTSVRSASDGPVGGDMGRDAAKGPGQGGEPEGTGGEGGDGGYTFDPSMPEANRIRMQGGGVGQKEMDLQRDPNRLNDSEKY